MAEKEVLARLGKQIITEDDLRIKVTVKDEDYELRYPNPNQRSFIEVQIARRFDGMARESFPLGYRQEVIVRETLDAIYVPDNCPDWFTPWDCLDFDILMELYDKYIEFHRGFQKRVEERKFTQRDK